MRGSTLLVVFAMAVGLAILLALGTWQVQRLHWKEALIERVNKRLEAEPVTVANVLQAANGRPEAIDYTPVTLSGTFELDHSFFEFTTHKGQSGWNVFNLLKSAMPIGDGASVYMLVNRGFIPYDARKNWTDVAPLPSGNQTVTGLLRVPPLKKPGSLMPDNEPDNGLYYWRDLQTMAMAAGLKGGEVSQYYLDQGLPGGPVPVTGKYPIPGTTIISFPNNHLQYAVTWYGLALALLGVGSYFLYARRKTKPASKTG